MKIIILSFQYNPQYSCRPCLPWKYLENIFRWFSWSLTLNRKEHKKNPQFISSTRISSRRMQKFQQLSFLISPDDISGVSDTDENKKVYEVNYDFWLWNVISGAAFSVLRCQLARELGSFTRFFIIMQDEFHVEENWTLKNIYFLRRWGKCWMSSRI